MKLLNMSGALRNQTGSILANHILVESYCLANSSSPALFYVFRRALCAPVPHTKNLEVWGFD